MGKADKKYVSEQVFSSRITAKGKVTSLTGGFKLKDEQPFSVYVRPKTLTTLERDVVISARLYKEEECSDVPVTLFGWQPLMICELAASNAALLATYDIYYGCGNTATELE